MSLIFQPETSEIRKALGLADVWPECSIVDTPVKRPESPRLLVKRNVQPIDGPHDEEIFYLPGNPCISLFTGAGGMDIGMERAGFCTLVQAEWDYSACQTLMANRPRYFRDSALIQGDIRQIPTSMLLQAAGLEVGEAHLVAGGPPCQGFSTDNSHSGSGRYDERNDLVFEYLRVVSEAKPKFFVMENVPGFLSFKGQVNGTEYAEHFCRQAFECYYELVYGLINAVDYGVPQYRTRFICMGTRRDLAENKGILASLPGATHFSQRDLDQMASSLFPDQDIACHPPGVRYFPDRPFLKPPHPNHDGQRSQAFIEFYSGLIQNEPDRLVRQAA
jgi:DNA (cytosine-5)-methyltransferase 1